MIVEEPARRWTERHGSARLHAWLSFVEDRVELGAGGVLAQIARTRGGEIGVFFAGGEEKGRARLAVAYMRPICDQDVEVLRKAARDWMAGDNALALIRLAQARLGKFDDPKLCSYRLFLADHLLCERDVSACDLLKGLDLEASTQAGIALAKYDPDQPRVPAGQSDGGQWTDGGAVGAGAAHLIPAQFVPPILAEPPVLPPLLAEPPVTTPPPPLPEWPTDPTAPPGPGWVWRGGPKGAWYDEELKQTLRPDFDHSPPIEPHWDWRTPGKGTWYRWFSDGRIEPKQGK